MPLTRSTTHRPAPLPTGHRVRHPGARRLLGVLMGAVCLAGCGSALPPLTWVHLPLELPAMATPAPGSGTAGSAAPSGEVWQLMAPVSLPGYLDRDALLLPQGPSGLQALAGVRWAEPLRDAVPRLLRADLSRSLGGTVWAAPLPPGVRPSRQLRLEVQALDVTPDGRGVSLKARWSLAEPSGHSAPRVGETALVVAADGPEAGALAAAHRMAIHLLAQRVVASLVAAPP